MLGRALSRSYGRYFAEFLGEKSLVRLGLLDLTTCVGLGYGRIILNLRSFSWKTLRQNLTTEVGIYPDPDSCVARICLSYESWKQKRQFNKAP